MNHGLHSYLVRRSAIQVKTYLKRSLMIIISLLFSTAVMAEWQWTAGIEHRDFRNQGKYPQQVDQQTSIFVQPEYQWRSDSSDMSFNLVGYYRYDNEDDRRSRGDLREALLTHWFGDFEYRIGVGKVYWGVTESLQLVDIINQTDAADAIDGDSKLGQPMLHGLWYSGIGRLEAFVLPGFRERTFTGEKGRFRTGIPVNEEAEYESDDGDSHLDYAVRWSQSFDLLEENLDLTANYFRGTSRDPIVQSLVDDQFVTTDIVAYYPQINQYAATAQYTWGNWLFKAEGLLRYFQDETIDSFKASVSGFEYTLYSPFEITADVGILFEFQYDERGFQQSANHKDLFIGSRIAFNDAASTELLFGLTQDLDNEKSQLFFAEASRRISNFMTIDVNLLLVGAQDDMDPLFILSSDDTLEVALNFYF